MNGLKSWDEYGSIFYPKTINHHLSCSVTMQSSRQRWQLARGSRKPISQSWFSVTHLDTRLLRIQQLDWRIQVVAPVRAKGSFLKPISIMHRGHVSSGETSLITQTRPEIWMSTILPLSPSNTILHVQLLRNPQFLLLSMSNLWEIRVWN